MTKMKREEVMAENYINGNLSEVWKWVGNSAKKLLAVHRALGVHGSDVQRGFIYSARNHIGDMS